MWSEWWPEVSFPDHPLLFRRPSSVDTSQSTGSHTGSSSLSTCTKVDFIALHLRPKKKREPSWKPPLGLSLECASKSVKGQSCYQLWGKSMISLSWKSWARTLVLPLPPVRPGPRSQSPRLGQPSLVEHLLMCQARTVWVQEGVPGGHRLKAAVLSIP